MKIELKQIDPLKLGLSKRIRVSLGLDRNYYIIKNIKSRIIMKDGKKIKEIVNTIKNQTNKQVFLATTAPICSKTKTYLESKSIQMVTDFKNN